MPGRERSAGGQVGPLVWGQDLTCRTEAGVARRMSPLSVKKFSYQNELFQFAIQGIQEFRTLPSLLNISHLTHGVPPLSLPLRLRTVIPSLPELVVLRIESLAVHGEVLVSAVARAETL